MKILNGESATTVETSPGTAELGRSPPGIG